MLDSATSQVDTAADGALSTDALEREITTLAAHLDAATYQFLRLLADFDRRGGWDGFGGMRTCAHWLNWKCGIGLVAAREKLRVAHALEHLPRISDVMRRGALSYAKVRAMTRVATAENEEFLLIVAQNGTATHVEAVVRHYRRTQRLEELEHDRARYDARSLRYYWDDDGCLVIEGRLPPEQGAVVVKALEAAEHVLRGANRGSSQQLARTPGDVRGVAAETEPACNASAEASCEVKLPHDAVLAASAADAASAEALPSDNPSWENRRADALTLMAETLFARGPAGLRGADKYLVHVHVDLATLRGHHMDGVGAVQGGPPLPAATVRRLCCESGLTTWLEDPSGRALDIGRKTRAIPPPLRRALEKRDQGCQFPGCTSHRFVDAHHIEHWADGGETKLENLTLLCRHHHRLIHEGGFTVSREGDAVRFADPAGHLLAAVPPAPDLPIAGAAFLSEEHLRRGLMIDDQTAVTDWRGERADYDYMVAVLCQYEKQPAAVVSTSQRSLVLSGSPPDRP